MQQPGVEDARIFLLKKYLTQPVSSVTAINNIDNVSNNDVPSKIEA